MTPAARSPNVPVHVVRVLVVEDVEAMRQLLNHLLEGIQGVQVSGLAANTWEARLEISRRRPDLVLLDEILPGESSIDLLQELVSSGIPVLLMTGVEKPTHALPAGARGRLQKPSWDSIDSDRSRIAGAIFSVFPG